MKATDNDAAIEALIDATQTVIQLDKGQRSGGAALKSVQQAHTKLASVDISKAERSTVPKISKQLEAIKTVVADLEKKIAKLKP